MGHRYGLSDADVDELAQELRIRLWRALKDSEKIATASAFYVQRAALSAAVDLVRRRRARREISLDQVATRMEMAADPRVTVHPHERLEESNELRDRLAEALETLAPPRDVVVRLHLTGYDRNEIADLMGWTEPKVRNLLYRGLADLRSRLRALGVAEASQENR